MLAVRFWDFLPACNVAVDHAGAGAGLVLEVALYGVCCEGGVALELGIAYYVYLQIDGEVCPEVAETERHVPGWCEGGEFMVVKDPIAGKVPDRVFPFLQGRFANGDCGIRGRIATIIVETDANRAEGRG